MQGEHLASWDDQTQPLSLLQDEPRDHPLGRDDLCLVSTFASERGGPLNERGIDISYETVRFWWNRFGPLFATEIRKKGVSRLMGWLADANGQVGDSARAPSLPFLP